MTMEQASLKNVLLLWEEKSNMGISSLCLALQEAYMNKCVLKLSITFSTHMLLMSRSFLIPSAKNIFACV